MDPNLVALGIAVVTLLIVFKWPKTWGKIVPPPLAALVIATLISLVVPGAPILGDIPTGLPSFLMPSFSQDTLLIVMEAAIILALLGSIDSLLTSLVADNMTRTKHNSNRELVGQGLGNMAAGFFGGIPGAGATMRTVVNIRTGGQTKISGIVPQLTAAGDRGYPSAARLADTACGARRNTGEGRLRHYRRLLSEKCPPWAALGPCTYGACARADGIRRSYHRSRSGRCYGCVSIR